MGTSSVIANSRPSILYVFMHSLNRPRFTVCPGQTWNVPATFNEKLMSFHRPDWHWGKSANPVSGLEGPKLTQMPVCGYHRQMPGLTLDKDNFTRLLIAQRVISRQEAASCYGQKDWMMSMSTPIAAHLASTHYAVHNTFAAR